MNGLTLITPTGNRPQALKLCTLFVNRQDWAGPLQWIVVDDGTPPDDIYVRAGIELSHILPSPSWRPGQNTQARNLLVAIPEVRYDKVVIVEDDDRYSVDYCHIMAGELDSCALVGDPDSRYYHLSTRQWRVMKNSCAASLCQTAMRSEKLPALERACLDRPDCIDGSLWTSEHKSAHLIRYEGCVGMKGMPGRTGIGTGHQPQRQPEKWNPDTNLQVLRSWIGDDVDLYQEFL